MFLPNGLTDQVVFSGTDLVLSCEATGAPTPSYQWLKDGGVAHTVFGFDTSVPGQLHVFCISDRFTPKCFSYRDGILS